MWASITQSIARDLGEFASVLQSDTHKLVQKTTSRGVTPVDGGAAAAASNDVSASTELSGAPASSVQEPLFLGDEGTAGGVAYSLVPVEKLLPLVSDPSTFSAPFTAQEAAAAEDWDTTPYASTVGDLLRCNPIVAAFHYRFVVAPASAQRLSEEEFFRRYFFRLASQRRALGVVLLEKQRVAAAKLEAVKVGGGEWSDEVYPASSLDEANKRIAALESALKHLQQLVDYAGAENAALRKTLQATSALMASGVATAGLAGAAAETARPPNNEKKSGVDDEDLEKLLSGVATNASSTATGESAKEPPKKVLKGSDSDNELEGWAEVT